MTIKSQLYLLQLEDYHFDRYLAWLKNNPGKEVIQKKGKIRWTTKARILLILAFLAGSVAKAVRLYAPIDYLSHLLLVGAAKIKLRLLHSRVISIGITGSWGKTTTKEKLAAILMTRYRVFKTQGNHNTLLGVAIDILKMPLGTEIFVCEMGAYAQGDIREICNLVRPKVGVITVIGPMHLERFGRVEVIKKTKEEIWENIPANGLKIGPEEDPVRKLINYFSLDEEKITKVLKELKPPSHRMETLYANGVTVIDDSYNSNPTGFERALEKLRTTPSKPKILITPGMIELGKMQVAENERLAQLAVKIADHIIVVGEINKEAWVRGAGNVLLVQDMDQAKEKLTTLTRHGAVVLFENDLPDHYS